MSCCNIPWNTGNKTSSKELTAAASVLQTILFRNKKKNIKEISLEFLKINLLYSQ